MPFINDGFGCGLPGGCWAWWLSLPRSDLLVVAKQLVS